MTPLDDAESDHAAFTIIISNLSGDVREFAYRIKEYLFKERKGNEELLSVEERQCLVDVLNDHQYSELYGICSCGWSCVEKNSHAEHVVSEFEKRWNG